MVFFVAVCITCPFTSISMQQNEKNAASVEAFILGSLIQVSFSPLTRVINSQRANWDHFSRGLHCSTTRGYSTMLVPGLFSSSASCQWRHISASLCDGSLASLTGYECRSGFWGLKMGELLNRDLHCHLQPYLRRIALVMWPVSLLSQRMTLCHQFHVFPLHAITSYM